jgi:hypothetical protein
MGNFNPLKISLISSLNEESTRIMGPLSVMVGETLKNMTCRAEGRTFNNIGKMGLVQALSAVIFRKTTCFCVFRRSSFGW